MCGVSAIGRQTRGPVGLIVEELLLTLGLPLVNVNTNCSSCAANNWDPHEKVLQKCRAIFLSPIFYVEKSINFLNIYKFNYLSSSNKVNILALGGISDNNIGKLKLLYIKGFGGISIFKKKPALKKAGFYKF